MAGLSEGGITPQKPSSRKERIGGSISHIGTRIGYTENTQTTSGLRLTLQRISGSPRMQSSSGSTNTASRGEQPAKHEPSNGGVRLGKRTQCTVILERRTPTGAGGAPRIGRRSIRRKSGGKWFRRCGPETSIAANCAGHRSTASTSTILSRSPRRRTGQIPTTLFSSVGNATTSSTVRGTSKGCS